MRDPMKAALTALCLGVLSAAALSPPAAAARTEVQTPDAQAPDGEPSGQPDGPAQPSSEALGQFMDWVIASGDNRGLPFAIIDKVAAVVFVFGPDGRLTGAAPVLVGFAQGDDSVPGIGDREMSGILPEERTTPAGRFVAGFGPAANGEEVLWVDYETAVSLHHVVVANPSEHRLQRLESPTPDDNRITYGCINVPAGFYEEVIRPAFTGTEGVVYVLPETRPLDEVFPDFRWREQAAPAAEAPSTVWAEETPPDAARDPDSWADEIWPTPVLADAPMASSDRAGRVPPHWQDRDASWAKSPSGLGLLRPTGDDAPLD